MGILYSVKVSFCFEPKIKEKYILFFSSVINMSFYDLDYILLGVCCSLMTPVFIMTRTRDYYVLTFKKKGHVTLGIFESYR